MLAQLAVELVALQLAEVHDRHLGACGQWGLRSIRLCCLKMAGIKLGLDASSETDGGQFGDRDTVTPNVDYDSRDFLS